MKCTTLITDRQYCMDHQAFSKQMHAMMREALRKGCQRPASWQVSDAADFLDTAQSARCAPEILNMVYIV